MRKTQKKGSLFLVNDQGWERGKVISGVWKRRATESVVKKR